MNSYQISREGQMLGEFVESQIHEGLQTGYFQTTYWCWTQGMAEWQGLGTLFQQPQARALPQPAMTPSVKAVNPYAAPRTPQRAHVAPIPRPTFQKASRIERLGAVLLDQLILFGCFIPASFMSEGSKVAENDQTMLMIVGLLFLSVALTNLVLIGMFGQTIGKKMVGIRIARTDDGSKAGFFQILLARNFLAQGLLYIVPLYGLIDICFIFGDEQSCLHDKIAGTQVLKSE